MKTPDYSKLDAALVAVITQLQPVELYEILRARKVRRQAEALEASTKGRRAGTGDEVPSWRFVDRRLQALKRARTIRFQSVTGARGWVPVLGCKI